MALAFASHATGSFPAGANPGVTMTALEANTTYLVAMVTVQNSADAVYCQPSGMTDTGWTEIQTYKYRTTSFSRRLGLFWTRTGSNPSGTTLTAAGVDAGGTGGVAVIVKVTGCVSGDPKVQEKHPFEDTAGTSQTCTLDAGLANTANAILMASANRGGGAQTANGGGTMLVNFGEIGIIYAVNDTSVGSSWGVSDNMGFIGLEVRAQAQQAVGGTITPTGTLTALKTILRSLAGAITPTGTVALSKAISLAGSIVPTGTLALHKAVKLLTAAVAGAVSLAAKAKGALVLDPDQEGSVTLTPADPDPLTLDPADQDTITLVPDPTEEAP